MIYFSIVIPHRNSPDYLFRCLDSIPTREDLQVIVVDDNSHCHIIDYMCKALEKFKRVELVRLKEYGGGAGHARNVGLQYVKGKYVLFSDCDDVYTSELNSLFDKYANSEFDVVYFDFKYKYKYHESNPICSKMIENKEKEDMDYIKYRILAPWNKMVSMSLIKSNNIRFEEAMNGNDIFYSFQVGYWSKMIDFYPEVIYCYYRDTNGLTRGKHYSDMYYICLFGHIYQCNEFYRFINRSKWTRSIIVEFLAVFYRQGGVAFLRSIWAYIGNRNKIVQFKMKFVDYFKG